MGGRRVVLLYISEISGHHSATIAIEKALKIIHADIEILNINAFHYTNPVSEKIVNRIYMGIIKRTPRIWEYLYDNPAVMERLQGLRERVQRFNAEKLKKLFGEFKPHIIASTQAFPCGMAAEYKRYFNARLPLVAVLTDYAAHSYWIDDRIDYYVVPSDEVAHRFHKKGVSGHKIKAFGIPFDPIFQEACDKEQIRLKLGLNSGIPTVLIMGGGQGLGPIKTIVRAIDKLHFGLQAIVVTGTNRKLHVSLKAETKEFHKKVLVFGYTQAVHELMTVAGLIITKPGGITTAEALAKHLPMIIVKPIPGQEANNTAYLTKHHAAAKVDNPKLVGAAVQKLLLDPSALRWMRESAQRIAKPEASFDIARLLLDLAGQADD